MIQTRPAQREVIGAVHLAAASLTVFRGVLDSAVGAAVLRLLHLLNTRAARPDELLSAYGSAFALLANEAVATTGDGTGDAWQRYLLDRLLADDNAFSRQAQLGDGNGVAPGLRAAVAADLDALQRLHALDAGAITRAIADRLDIVDGSVTRPMPWSDLGLPRCRAALPDSPIEQQMAVSDDWRSLVDELAAHFAAAGSGPFAQYRAFRWVRDDRGGRLEGIAEPDPIRLADFVGYERERALLIQNTEQFVAGLPANNVLLYGDRGSGKSSTVKALLWEFADRGLRLIEVAKHDLADYPLIVPMLRGRRQRFILFVDDLSFEERETEYKHLKALLEGSLEARPGNVLLYATSNRRHLIVERFSDRGEPGDEIHTFDTAQEKLSLSDRFGISVTFTTPGQDAYLTIVAALAERRKLPIDGAALRARALAWAQQQRARSCRTARQFVDHLTGELALARPPEG